MKKFARQLFDAGFPVTPVLKKRPLLPKWQNRLDDSVLEEREWCNASGFGLLLGQKTGVICLDIDLEDTFNPHYCWLQDNLPPLFSGVKGSKKRPSARFFKYSGEKSKKYYLTGGHAPDVELLSDGNQKVLPPSLHVEGHEYEWKGIPLFQTSLDGLPELPKEILNYLTTNNRQITSVISGTGIIFESGRCGHGSHLHLSKIGVALFHEGLSLERIVNRLITEDYQINSESTHYYFQCPTRSEFNDLTINESAEKFVGEIFYRNKREKIKEIIEENPHQYILTPLVAKIKEEILSLSPRPDETIATVGAITLISLVIGRTVSIDDVMPNLCQFIVSPYASGKGIFKKIIELVLGKLGMSSLIPAGNITSYSGGAMNFEERRHWPEVIILNDEAEDNIKNMAKNINSTSDFFKNFSTYDWGSFSEGRRTLSTGGLGMPPIGHMIQSPYFSYTGLLTPEGFQEYFPRDAKTSGFLSRLMVFYQDSIESKHLNRKSLSEEKITEMLRPLAEKCRASSRGRMANLSCRVMAQKNISENFSRSDKARDKAGSEKQRLKDEIEVLTPRHCHLKFDMNAKKEIDIIFKNNDTILRKNHKQGLDYNRNARFDIRFLKHLQIFHCSVYESSFDRFPIGVEVVEITKRYLDWVDTLTFGNIAVKTFKEIQIEKVIRILKKKGPMLVGPLKNFSKIKKKGTLWSVDSLMLKNMVSEGLVKYNEKTKEYFN